MYIWDTQPDIKLELPVNWRKDDFFSYNVQAGEKRLIESAEQVNEA
jgi:hypothetical protein